MNVDYNKIVPLLPDESQQKIHKEVISYFGAIASSMGFEMREKVPENVEPLAPVQTPPTQLFEEGKRQYLTWPVELHGLRIPNKERLVELYKDARGATKTWQRGTLKWSTIQYMRNTKGMTLEEIFPYPPPETARRKLLAEMREERPGQTRLKRLDKSGNEFSPL